MLTQLSSCVNWCGAKAKAAFEIVRSEAADVLVHTSAEGFLVGQGSFFASQQFLASMLEYITSETTSFFISLPFATFISALLSWGAYNWHKGGDEGNAEEVIIAYDTGRIQTALAAANIPMLTEKDVMKKKQKLQGLCERGSHSLGFSGALGECLLAATYLANKYGDYAYTPNGYVKGAVQGFGFLMGLWASNQEITNGKKGLIRKQNFALFKKLEEEQKQDLEAHQEEKSPSNSSNDESDLVSSDLHDPVSNSISNNSISTNSISDFVYPDEALNDLDEPLLDKPQTQTYKSN